jgi:dienelactone hydrolase
MKFLPIAFISALCMISNAALANQPMVEKVVSYETTIEKNKDAADIYFPLFSNNNDTSKLPIVLMLQGAFVDKSDYSNYASQVASYGFVVVVPNRIRTALTPSGQSFTGLISEQQQVYDTQEQLVKENTNPASPIYGKVDTEKVGLLGHSLGGFAGLGAIQEEFCFPSICNSGYKVPPQLKAGIFYAAPFGDAQSQTAFPLDNKNIPVGLIVGTQDGVTSFNVLKETYNQVKNPPKVFIEVEGANHYSITNNDNLIREKNRPTLDQATATETIARWSGLFLRASMLNDVDAFNYVYGTGDELDKNVRVISQSKSIPENDSVLSLFLFGVAAFPFKRVIAALK